MTNKKAEPQHIRADLARGRARELVYKLTCDYDKNIKRFTKAFTTGKSMATNPKAEMRLIRRIKRASQSTRNIAISELININNCKFFVWHSWKPITLEDDAFGAALMSLDIGVNRPAWDQMNEPVQSRMLMILRQHALERLCERSDEPESDLMDTLLYGNACLRATLYSLDETIKSYKDALIPTANGAFVSHVLLAGESSTPVIIPNTFLVTSQLRPELRKIRSLLLDTIDDAGEEEVACERSIPIWMDCEKINIPQTTLSLELGPIMNKLPRTHSNLLDRAVARARSS